MFESRFQSFEETADRTQGPPRLALLRAELARRGLDGFLVPRSDEHQNEYVPPSAERLAWLTGFTGSAGSAAVLADRAAIFVDGRYREQVREQVDTAVITPVDVAATAPDAWIRDNLRAGQKLGYDPRLTTLDGAEKLARAVEAAGGELVAVDLNPIDTVWADRPAPPLAPARLHDEKLAGESAAQKLARVAKKLEGERADAVLVTDAHNLAWAFNLRGGDVAHTPLPLGFAVLRREGRPLLFLDGRKLGNSVRSALEDLAEIREPASLEDALDEIGRSDATVLVDAGTASAHLARRLEAAGAKLKRATDPVALLKAVKNEAEAAGSRAAHLRDGAAVARFLAWFDREAPAGGLTEIACAEALETFRRETGVLKDVSFPSISSAGPNAALPHYRVTRRSNRRIEPGIYLIDSGAQYEDGTTDITRTIAVGEPTAEMRDRFTRVLKGHIAIATAVFPKGTTGAQLDSFARRPLWEAGLDFDHGTGHGIGSYLSVHEGPQRLAKTGHVPLEPGMMLSNEPGYYKPGAWGIRIENLVLVERREVSGGEREMLGFETLSFAPIDRRLVEPALLTQGELAWLDIYHADVLAKIGPLVDEATLDFLEDACAAL